MKLSSLSTLILLIVLSQLVAKVEMDTLHCYTSLSPFLDGSYYGETQEYQQNYGGDINGDGYQDLVLSGKCNDADNGELHIHFGGDQLSITPDLIIKGNELPVTNYNFGSRFSYNGDINGDGIDDLIVAASSVYTWSITGNVFIFLGSPNFNSEPDFILDGADYGYDPNGLNFGGWLDSSGDINGDGIDDLLVHSIGPSLYFNGQINLFFGNENFDTASDWMISGAIAKIHGQKVTHGDLNGDGFDEIISMQDIETSNTGKKIIIYSGGESPTNTPVWSYQFDDIPWDTERFLESGKDLNCDGYDDLVLAYKSLDSSSEFKILFFEGDQSTFLKAPQLYSSNDSHLQNIILCDYNSDSITDIIVHTYSYVSNIYKNFFTVIYGCSNFELEPDDNFSKNSEFQYTSTIKSVGNINGNESYLLTEKKLDNKDYDTRYGLFKKNNGSNLFDTTVNDNFLYQNFPNPFNPITIIKYSLKPHLKSPKIKVYDISGKLVSTKLLPLNKNSINFDGSSLNSGLYLCILEVDNKVLDTIKMTIIK